MSNFLNSRTVSANLGRDLVASVVVFLVALPLCMGIAVASGAPPSAGLITGIAGGMVVGWIAGAPLQVSGPAAGLTVLVWELIHEHGLEVLGVVVVVAGLLQVVSGLLKLGQWFRAISPAVIYGMLAGIGILIIASQFHVMLDAKPLGRGIDNLLSIPGAIYRSFDPGNGKSQSAALIGLLTLAVLLLWEKLRPRRLAQLPGALMGAAVATAVSAIWELDISYVRVPDNLLEATFQPRWESFRSILNPDLIAAALTVAFVASAESLLTASAVDRMHTGPRANYDRELAAQGVGNVVAGLFGGLPMTGVIVRSAANIQAGAASRLSTIFHGAWLLAFAVALPGALNIIPVSSLAAVLLYTGFKLLSLEKIRDLAALSRGEVIIYGATLAGIVAADLLTGVVLGLALTFVRLLYVFTHLSVRVERPSEARVDVYLEGAATLVRLPKLATTLERLPEAAEVHVHCDGLDHIDHACLELIADWERQQSVRGTRAVIEWDDLALRYQPKPSRCKNITEPVAAD